jgi:endo-alpha-1,4-polygalactosaminidase (GH114 family)
MLHMREVQHIHECRKLSTQFNTFDTFDGIHIVPCVHAMQDAECRRPGCRKGKAIFVLSYSSDLRSQQEKEDVADINSKHKGCYPAVEGLQHGNWLIMINLSHVQD